jgi:hypothetical protein
MAKQIERRMIADLLIRLRGGGFDIGNYQYTGMGSIYFVDFILFHRFVGIRRMVSVEYGDDIRKRVKFNKPFNCVQVEYGAIGDYIPKLDRDISHILWLDYDEHIKESILVDVVNATAALPRGSMLLVTVDINPPKEGTNPREWREYFENRTGRYFDSSLRPSAFAQSNLARINIDLIQSALKQGLAGREVSFISLMNFLYADGHEMLTVGGMIGSATETRKIQNCDFSDATYLRRRLDEEPYRIPLVRVTRKERLYLDSKMPGQKATWTPTEFEMDEVLVREYADVYRYLPSYAELLV